MDNDIINAIFGIVLTSAQGLNLYKLYKDFDLKGVSLISCLVFTIYGLWVVYYYNSLNQLYSFYVACASATFVVGYFGLACYLKLKKPIK